MKWRDAMRSRICVGSYVTLVSLNSAHTQCKCLLMLQQTATGRLLNVSGLLCRRMRGLDATAARSFGTLASSLGIMGVQMLVTHLDPDTETARLLVRRTSSRMLCRCVLQCYDVEHMLYKLIMLMCCFCSPGGPRRDAAPCQ